jgi:hypothetical protein
MATQEALSGISSDKFWTSIDGLIATSQVVIDRPKGSRHSKVDEAIDYARQAQLAARTLVIAPVTTHR